MLCETKIGIQLFAHYLIGTQAKKKNQFKGESRRGEKYK